MNANALPSEISAKIAQIDPDVLTATTHTSDYADMGMFESALAEINIGTMGASATVDAKLVQATDSSGTGSKDITGKAITQMTQAGTDQSDTQAEINLRAEELDLANGFSHVALVITVAAASCDGSGSIRGFNSRFGPAYENDLASVGEIVT